MRLNVNTVMFYFALFERRLMIEHYDPRTRQALILIDVS